MTIRQRVQSWVETPEFSDPEKARRAHLTMSILRFTLVAAFLVVVLAFLDPRNRAAVTLTVYSPLFLMVIGCIGLVKNGHVRAAGWVISTGLWAFTTLMLWTFGGLRDQTGTTYIIVIMVAGATLGGRVALLFAGMSVAAAGAVVWMDGLGMLPIPLAPMAGFNSWIALTAALVLGTLLLDLSIRSLDAARLRATRNERDLRISEARNALRARHGEAVGRLAKKVLETTGRDHFCAETCEVMASELGVDAVGAFEVDAKGELRFLNGVNWPDRPRANIADGAPEVLQALLESGEPAVFRLADDPVFRVCFGDVEGVALIGVIPSPKGAHGLLCAVALGDRIFSSEDELFLSTVAGILGAALERESATGRFLQAQKMEVVGRLAGGIAHDFNNLLTVMVTAVNELKVAAPTDKRSQLLLDDLDGATERAALITGRLLAFSRTEADAPQRVDLNEVVGGLLKVLRRLLGANLTVERDLCEEPLSVNADRASLEQVVLNLAVNARDAMPEGGTIRFSTGFVSDPAGSRARLEVRDTGGGMDDESRRRIFEPFYTTKQGGTGLGLSTVQDIVERIRGEVRVDSQLGVGTRFVIEFPIAEAPSSEATRSADPAEVPVRVGRLLLVEDDDMVRKSTRRILERGGYQVSSAVDGQDALLLLQANRDIDVIVTDLNMPRLGGVQLALELESLGFEIPVIFVSGRVEAPPDAPESFRFRTSFIQKPFYPADLLRAVADCLDDGDDGLRMSGSVDSKSRVV